MSNKSLYRDLEIIKGIGYEVKKDIQHRNFIEGIDATIYKLSEPEKKLIISTIRHVDPITKEVNNIIEKLKLRPPHPQPDGLRMLKGFKIIQNILIAISGNRPIILKNYRSTTINSSVRDRLVLPLHLDELKMTLTAFEFSKNKHRLYKIARIEDVELFEGQINKQLVEEIPSVDAFGCAGNIPLTISLLLSKRAASILMEEFTIVNEDLKPHSDGLYPFKYSGVVFQYEGIGRFVLGLLTEILVLESEPFKEYLKKKIMEKTIVTI
ncbi:MAG: WYL domain-containing protein [Saprospiraceae bacterium]